MCDFSLHTARTKDAELSDHMITTKFNSWTRGFSTLNDRNCAVCLKPGTEVAFEQPAKRRLGLWWKGRIGSNLARFRKVDEDKYFVHHDALEFANGKIVMLTDLKPGQLAHVVQLPFLAKPKAASHDVGQHTAAIADQHDQTPMGMLHRFGQA